MKTRILLTMLVLAMILPSLALAQPLPPQGEEQTPTTGVTTPDVTDDMADDADDDRLTTTPTTTTPSYAGTGTTGSTDENGVPLPPQVNDTTRVGTAPGTTGVAGAQDYWTNNLGVVSTDLRTSIMNRAQTVLGGYTSDALVMPSSTLNDAIASNNPNLYLLDVRPDGTTGTAGGATRISLANLANNYNNLPTDRTIVVVSDDETDSAVAVTVLRLAGYNAWIGEDGVDALRGTGTTGMTGTMGTADNNRTEGTSWIGNTTDRVSDTLGLDDNTNNDRVT